MFGLGSEEDLKSSRKRIADEVERDLGDDSAWNRLPEPAPRRAALATQISLRLDPEDATRLRRVAHSLGVGYTSLLRQWIQQRLHTEDALLSSFNYEPGGYSVIETGANVQITSRDYTIRDLAIA